MGYPLRAEAVEQPYVKVKKLGDSVKDKSFTGKFVLCTSRILFARKFAGYEERYGYDYD